ncbi:MAG: signal peptidase I [Clostridiales bacterium]|nr:signal peptidase I [Candidatus Apopatousia equi]
MDNNHIFAGKIYITKNERLMNRISTCFLCICCIICLILVAFGTIFTSAQVNGYSMYPTLNPDNTNENKHDVVYYTDLFGYNRGDIIIVDLPNRDELGIKRLIALGGDKVCFGDINNNEEMIIYVNGEALYEPYVNMTDNIAIEGRKRAIKDFKDEIKKYINGQNNYFTNTCKRVYLNKNNQYEIELKDDYFIYLGDNRGNSYDCSENGPQHISNLLAKVCITVPYGLSIYNVYWYKFCRLFK